ncbi:MAG: aromatic ring-opening dioxygenase [Alphaproteobacteria bacterium]|nr:aromatic ring-opening dioxygenase [Alphaproteobacteria bacterium]
MPRSPANDAPYHAHVYYAPADRAEALALRARFEKLAASGAEPRILFVGAPHEGPAGPHPRSQYEIHLLGAALAGVRAMIMASGLRALIHPLTEDDLADHTTLAHWIGEPLALDLATLDPPGLNQGLGRFGKTDV